ncbi:MAG TPA: ATP-binding cassette domain-containing protein [Ideonella sp.]|uniref:ABC transporter ATP-binding protein n=1 Tax=Ideonella sp. TaxID=1929293 RepID=UPI002C762C62|nr:ATP-binding cassette domain-containing protein [Ideonella sp.]HSI47935.1 ATP-binding cassette domain-containing protein [Ideonella sp.]
MPNIVFHQVNKRFDERADRHVFRDLNLHIRKGEFTVLVGPSGCGKSTLLRMIAGLEPVSGGELSFDELRVNELPPVKRGVAMVFQNYALYAHMTVYDNIGFGLKIAGLSKAERHALILDAARQLQLEELLQRKPTQLSGGQRQRVAIGRAIVRKPTAFLFDEPLSNLDANLRAQMRAEIAELHRKHGVTTVYVTHDQVEAMTLADRIVVLSRHGLEQFGTPDELFDTPANLFVAGFMGSHRMNLVPVDEPHAPLLQLLTGQSPAALAAAGIGTIGARPEDIELSDGSAASVQLVERLGAESLVHLTVASSPAPLCALSNDRSIAFGQGRAVRMPSHKLHRFDPEGNRIAP